MDRYQKRASLISRIIFIPEDDCGSQRRFGRLQALLRW